MWNNAEKLYKLQCFTKISVLIFLNISIRASKSRSERSVAGFGANLTLLASCKVLLNLSAIRHFDDP